MTVSYCALTMMLRTIILELPCLNNRGGLFCFKTNGESFCFENGGTRYMFCSENSGDLFRSENDDNPETVVIKQR